MPRGDGTGPWGMGSMTGRMSGYCAGYSWPGYEYPMLRQGIMAGFGQRRGFGSDRGWRRRFMNRTGRFFGWMPYQSGTAGPTPMSNPDAEKRFLQKQAEMLQGQLDEIKQRLDDLANHEAPKD